MPSSKIVSNTLDTTNWDIAIILDLGPDAVGDDPFLLALSKKIPHALQAYYTATGGATGGTKANVCLFKTDYQRQAIVSTGGRFSSLTSTEIDYNSSLKLLANRVFDKIGAQTTSQTWYAPTKSSYTGITISDDDIINTMANLFFLLSPATTYLTKLATAPTLSTPHQGVDSIDDLKTINHLKIYADTDACTNMTLYINV